MDALSSFNNQIDNITSDVLRNRQTSNLDKFKANLSDKELAEINAVSQEFESVFLSQMLKPMFQELRTDGQFGGGHGEEVFRGFLIDEIGKKFAASGGLGISDIVSKELIRLQGSVINPKDLLDSTKVQAYQDIANQTKQTIQ